MRGVKPLFFILRAPICASVGWVTGDMGPSATGRQLPGDPLEAMGQKLAEEGGISAGQGGPGAGAGRGQLGVGLSAPGGHGRDPGLALAPRGKWGLGGPPVTHWEGKFSGLLAGSVSSFCSLQDPLQPLGGLRG